MAELTIEDVLDIEYPGAPAWSDGGERVAATVYEDDGAALLVATAGPGGEEDPSTDRYRPGPGHVTEFVWRPGTSTVAVATDAGDLYLLDVPGDSNRLLVSAGGISAPTWGPDGDDLAYYRGGQPEIRSTASGTVREVDVPPRDRFLEGDRMLAWNDAGDRLALEFVDRGTTQVAVVDPGTGDCCWRTTGPAATGAPAWLADGRLLVDRRRDEGTVREVVALDLEGGETVLASEVDRDCGTVSAGTPRVSPDGKRVALVLPLDGWAHVHVADADTGTRTQLTSGAFEDRGLNDATPRWVDDETLVFASNRRDPGQRHLFTVTVPEGEVVPVVETAGTNVHPAPAPGGDRVAYVHADRARSPELRVAPMNPDGGDEAPADDAPGTPTAPRRVTESRVADWPVDPVAPEPVSFESRDGTTVRGYLIDPWGDAVEETAAGLPGLVWVHGGPMRQMRDGWHPARSYGLAYAAHQYLARRGYVGLLVNYRGGIGYGRAFRTALADGYGRDEMADVVAGGEFLRDHPHVDADAVGVWGLSYGGYATLQILGTHPDAFDLGVSIAGLADLRDHVAWATETKFPPSVSAQSVLLDGDPWTAPAEWDAASPVTHMDDYEAPLYSFHGTGDRYVDVGQQDTVVDVLLDRDVPFEAEYYPDESHVFARRAVWRRTLRKVESALDGHLRAAPERRPSTDG